MAQITTEKRTTPAMRSHTTPSAATKENTRHHNASSPSRGKGIEILDFHESWLEEVELYKDKMVMSKDYTHHNHHTASQSSQQSRNNYNSINNNNHRNPRRLHNQSIRSSAGSSSGRSPTKNQNQQHNNKSTSSQSRQKQTDATAAAVATAAPAKSPPPRITPKLNSVPAPVAGVLQSEPYKKVQVGNPWLCCMISLPCWLFVSFASFLCSLHVPVVAVRCLLPALPC